MTRAATAPEPAVTPGGLQLRGVTKRFGEVTAVDRVSLDVAEGADAVLLAQGLAAALA